MGQALDTFGWDAWFAQRFAPFAAGGLLPARVAVEHRSNYQLVAEAGPVVAELAGKLRHDAASRDAWPAVGDWVAVEVHGDGGATIHGVVPRRSCFKRGAIDGRAGEAQVVAANIDVVFLVSSCNSEFSPRRLERYLALAWDSGAAPVVLLSKADVVADATPLRAAAAAAAPGAPVIAVSAVTGQGVEDVRALLHDRKTGALLGSSGVGKSSLINALLGEDRLGTGAIRAFDDKGRHTTVRRELVMLPGGGLLIDTPGMRELQLHESEEGLAVAFDDVEALVAQCGFADCSHGPEPNCAVTRAVADGRLDPERLASWRKLGGELSHAERKRDKRLKAEASRKDKIGAKALRDAVKKKRG